MQSPILNVMTTAAIKASKGLLRDFGEVGHLQISRKGVSNFVTSADKKAEKVLMEELSKARPGYSFLVEESGAIGSETAEFRWVIDPLDGTHNFIHAIPYFCISIALERTHKDGVKEIVAGVVYDPIHNEMFTAERGKGGMVENRKLAVSRRDNFEEAVVVITTPRVNNQNTSLPLIEKVIGTNASLRYAGASALDLAYLAAGRYDAVVLSNQQPWDVAAGWLLVEEAGGKVTQLNGEPFALTQANLLASNQPFYPEMRKLLAV